MMQSTTNINQPSIQEADKNSYQNYPSAPPAPPPFSENHFIINLEEDLIDSYIG